MTMARELSRRSFCGEFSGEWKGSPLSESGEERRGEWGESKFVGESEVFMEGTTMLLEMVVVGMCLSHYQRFEL